MKVMNVQDLKIKYKTEIVPRMMEKFKYKNPLQVPRLVKIVLNAGIGEGARDIKVIEQAAAELSLLSGQKPIITKAKKAIANFKLKAGMPIGCKVTLRGERMYDFLLKLIHVAMPRIRDFQGVSPNSFDTRGNYTLGIKEHTIFPETADSMRPFGMNVTIVTTAKTAEEARELLAGLGMPFSKKIVSKK